MKWFMALIMFCQGLIAFEAVSRLVRTTREPYAVNASQVDSEDVKHGETLIVRRDFSRKAYCKVDADFFIINVDTDVLVRRSREPAGASGLGRSTLGIPISVDDLPPGRYKLRQFLHSDCGDRLHTAKVPDISFTVVP